MTYEYLIHWEYPLFILVFLAELMLLILLCILIVSHRFYAHIKRKQHNKRKTKISDYLFFLIENQKLPGDVPFTGKKSWKKQILEAMESYDRRISSEHWEKIKSILSKSYLIRYARRAAWSLFWKKRNRAARIFAIAPFKEDEEVMLYMMDDKEFIVRGPASLGAIRLESEQAIHKALYAVAHEEGYTRYYYQDLLLQSPEKTYPKILEFAQDPTLKKAALIILASRTWPSLIPFLKDDLISPDPEIRRLAFKTLTINGCENKEQFFANGLNDVDEKVILYAIEGVSFYNLRPYFSKLTELLQKGSFEVAVAAARALKKAGNDGMNLLNDQKEGLALEAVKYIQVFG